jgi:hypothetical protein
MQEELRPVGDEREEEIEAVVEAHQRLIEKEGVAAYRDQRGMATSKGSDPFDPKRWYGPGLAGDGATLREKYAAGWRMLKKAVAEWVDLHRERAQALGWLRETWREMGGWSPRALAQLFALLRVWSDGGTQNTEEVAQIVRLDAVVDFHLWLDNSGAVEAGFSMVMKKVVSGLLSGLAAFGSKIEFCWVKNGGRRDVLKQKRTREVEVRAPVSSKKQGGEKDVKEVGRPQDEEGKGGETDRAKPVKERASSSSSELPLVEGRARKGPKREEEVQEEEEAQEEDLDFKEEVKRRLAQRRREQEREQEREQRVNEAVEREWKEETMRKAALAAKVAEATKGRKGRQVKFAEDVNPEGEESDDHEGTGEGEGSLKITKDLRDKVEMLETPSRTLEMPDKEDVRKLEGLGHGGEASRGR